MEEVHNDKQSPEQQPEQAVPATEADRYNTVGIAEATQNMPLQAVASFTRAIELDPQNPGYYYNRGIVYANDGAYALALEDFTRALVINLPFAPNQFKARLAHSKR